MDTAVAVAIVATRICGRLGRRIILPPCEVLILFILWMDKTDGFVRKGCRFLCFSSVQPACQRLYHPPPDFFLFHLVLFSFFFTVVHLKIINTFLLASVSPALTHNFSLIPLDRT